MAQFSEKDWVWMLVPNGGEFEETVFTFQYIISINYNLFIYVFIIYSILHASTFLKNTISKKFAQKIHLQRSSHQLFNR